MFVPRISDVRRDAMQHQPHHQTLQLIRFPVERRSIESFHLFIHADAAAWAIKAPVLVATVSAIFVSPNHNRFHRRFGAQRQGNARVCI